MLTIDIETYQDDLPENYLKWKVGQIKAPSNWKDADKIEKYISEAKLEAMDKLALSPLTGKIILIGLMTDDSKLNFTNKFNLSNGKEVYYKGLAGDEPDILKEFWDIFGKYTLNNVDTVTYNGKLFDLPFIMNRSLMKKITLPRRFSMSDYLSKYRHTPHLDVYQWFGSGSLVEWAYRFGITDSLERDGNKIGIWYQPGLMQKVIDKNIIDVAQTSELYQYIKNML